MTKAEWLVSTDPTPMLDLLRGKASDRKLRLFACACCRAIWPFFQGQSRSRAAVIVSERYADGLATRMELKSARKKSLGCEVAATRSDAFKAGVETASAAGYAVRSLAIDYQGRDPILAGYTMHTPTQDRLADEQSIEQCKLLRDLFGLILFQQTTVNPHCLAWNDGTVSKVAHAIYDKSAFDRLPILADALEDAGCDNADILGHCRSEGPHVRGCWVVDLLLGKQ